MKRPVAITACASLVVGALMPFMFTNDAQAAADCSTESSAYSAANSHLAVAEYKVKHAKKKLAKAKRHHAKKRTIAKRHRTLRFARLDLRYARLARAHYFTVLTTCHSGSTPQTVTSPQASTSPSTSPSASTSPSSSTSPSASTSTGTTDPLAALLAQLQALLDPSQLVAVLDELRAQLVAAGAPSALTDAITQFENALNGVGDPTEAFQKLIEALAGASDIDPAKFQQALEDALAAFQAALSNPPTTPQGIVDLLLNTIADGLDSAGVPVLPSVLTQLDTALNALLGTLLGGIPGL
jgi:hypothetical protein